MPYTPPATSPSLSPLEEPLYGGLSSSTISFDNFNENLDFPTAIEELKDILSTSPQLSTSPRRKSAPDLRKPFLKVDLPFQLPLQQGFPSLVRKKSGEIVKSSLKKSKSEPVTPTFPKYVHFGADLEQIKLFDEAQRPQAVSCEVSSDESSEDDDDEKLFDFSGSDGEDEIEEEPELIISLPNRPIITTLHSSKPVFVESIFLSRDKKKLQGRIMVQNIAFQKKVDIRYTFDFWSTVSDVSATFAEGIPSKDNKNSFDLFVFAIELIDNSRNPIDGKTMYFAVHYQVDDRDYWDNNNGSNYQVNFKRITPPSSPSKKKSSQSSLNLQNSGWSMASRSKSLSESLCRSPPTLGSSPNLISVMVDSRKKLLGRYDIGDSLSAAQNIPRSTDTSNFTRNYQTYIAPTYDSENFRTYFPNNYIDGMPMSSSSSGFENSNPIAIPASRPAIGSSSYYDLVNQYCFYSGSPPIMTK